MPTRGHTLCKEFAVTECVHKLPFDQAIITKDIKMLDDLFGGVSPAQRLGCDRIVLTRLVSDVKQQFTK